ncbi:MAG: hypothetical protein ACR2Q4_03850 [Geminicoccaceae bacterium]
MKGYRKPTRWSDPDKTLFPHQVGFMSPPHDFDAAPSDFSRMKAVYENVPPHCKHMHRHRLRASACESED